MIAHLPTTRVCGCTRTADAGKPAKQACPAAGSYEGPVTGMLGERTSPAVGLSRLPCESWPRACMRAGIVYGLYLTFSTWLLYFIATKTQFFPGSIKMFSLNDQAGAAGRPLLSLC